MPKAPTSPSKDKTINNAKKHKSPKTGDSTEGMTLMLSIFAASVLMLIGTVVYKKRLR